MMKQVFATLLLFVAFGLTLQAQIQSPAPSPTVKMEQEVGLQTITVEYSRPGVKGRTVFAADGLSPYGQYWRTGANASTKVTFSGDVQINGQDLAKGKYALYTVPGRDEWSVIFYKDLKNMGNPSSLEEDQIALKTTVKPLTIGMKIESFTIDFQNFTDNSVDMNLMWENTLVAIPVSMDTETAVMASIDKTLGGPTARDYYLAGRYYHESGKDLNKAYEYVHKSNEMDAKYWQLRREAMILADMEKYGEAIEIATQSKEQAMQAENMEYVKMNEKSISMWKEKMMAEPKKLKKAASSKTEKM